MNTSKILQGSLRYQIYHNPYYRLVGRNGDLYMQRYSKAYDVVSSHLFWTVDDYIFNNFTVYNATKLDHAIKKLNEQITNT
jgi:hypothetical protein